MRAERCRYCGLVRGAPQACPEGSGQACRADTNPLANIWTALGACIGVLIIVAALKLGGLI